MKTINHLPTLFVMVLVGCSTGEPIETYDVDEASASGGGGTTPGQTPGPTCDSPRCYQSNTSAYAVKSTSYQLYPALSANATVNTAGTFWSSALDGVAAVTSHDHSPSVLARTTAANDATAVEARATGSGGRPLVLKKPSTDGSSLLVARSLGNVFLIGPNGDISRNHVQIGKRGPPGIAGTGGQTGPQGRVGKPGRAGSSDVSFQCGAFRRCLDVCRGRVVGEAVGTCEVGLGTVDGCSYGGVDGRCCACSS